MNKYQIALDRLICNIGVAKSNYIKSGTAEEDMNKSKRRKKNERKRNV